MYDNACKLHLYHLNHKTALHHKARFFEDTFHWKGHVGCSNGYSLDSYKSINIKNINSQVDVQALQRVKARLAYIKPDKLQVHYPFFFCIMNKNILDKLNALDLSSLSV